MGNLIIKKVKYTGKNYEYESPELDKGLNVLLGENGNGKSTFVYLIYYGLGNKVNYFKKDYDEHLIEIANDDDNYVELIIEIDQNKYSLIREIGSNEIQIKDSKNIVETYSISRTSYLFKMMNKNFSDWLLEKLNISAAEITQFNTTHKINIDDLFRLIYVDQKTDASFIYKNPDDDNFFKKSLIVRKSIFEILIGDFFQEYYSVYSQLKEKEREKNESKNKVSNIENFIEEFKKNSNLKTFEEEIIHLEIFKLKNVIENKFLERKRLLKTESFSREITRQIGQIQNNVKELIFKSSNLKKEYKDLSYDLTNTLKAKTKIINDISYINKIIYTSKKIDIFALDKCPFCYENIDLPKGKCICGSDNSLNFEKFIYSSKEYGKILAHKIKLLDFINTNVEELKNDLNNLKTEIAFINKQTEEEKRILANFLENNNELLNLKALDTIQENILEKKITLKTLEMLKEKIVIKLKEEKKLDSLKNKILILKQKIEKLEQKKEETLENNIEKFEKIYSTFFKQMYGEKIKSIHLNKSYMPVINNGAYTETSFDVPKRILYYLSLLKLSMDININFPKFLIIDTISNNGIDRDKILDLIEILRTISNCQIILTSGYKEYEKNENDIIIGELNKSNKLLKNKIDNQG